MLTLAELAPVCSSREQAVEACASRPCVPPRDALRERPNAAKSLALGTFLSLAAVQQAVQEDGRLLERLLRSLDRDHLEDALVDTLVGLDCPNDLLVLMNVSWAARRGNGRVYLKGVEDQWSGGLVTTLLDALQSSS